MSKGSDFERASSGETSDYSANSLNFAEFRCSSVSSASSLGSVDSTTGIGSARDGREAHLATSEILVAADNVHKGMAVRMYVRCVFLFSRASKITST